MKEKQDYYEQDISIEVLKERAAYYAVEKKEDLGQFLGYFIVFRLSDQWFAIETHTVNQVIMLKDGVVVPRAKSLLTGLINHKGMFLPMVDVRQFLHIPPVALENKTQARLLIIDSNSGAFCFLVDEFYKVVEIYEKDVLSQGTQSKDRASKLIESIVAIDLDNKKQKVVWLKAEELKRMVKEGL